MSTRRGKKKASAKQGALKKSRAKGVMLWFDAGKGYGFIKPVSRLQSVSCQSRIACPRTAWVAHCLSDDSLGVLVRRTHHQGRLALLGDSTHEIFSCTKTPFRPQVRSAAHLTTHSGGLAEQLLSLCLR